MLGRSDAYPVLKDAIAAMDEDIQKLRQVIAADPKNPLKPGHSATLANYARVLADCTNKQSKWDEERLKAMKDEDLKALAQLATKEMRERAGVS